MLYVLAFILPAMLSILFTFMVKKYARRRGIVDIPDGARKKHAQPTPLLGGVGVYVAFVISVVLLTVPFSSFFFGGYLLEKHIIGLLLGGFVLVLGGYLDDVYTLKPWQQIIFPIIASCMVIASGIGINYLSNPFGETFDFTQYQITLFEFGGVPYQLTLIADVFAFIWLIGMMYTTKILDGIDGLVAGLTVISSVALFVLSLSENVMQPETALLSIMLAGSFLGFLFYNFHPAKIFLGESGSLLAGFFIGVLAIISGGKLATALLIFSIPIVDLMFVVIERIVNRQSPFKHADTKHLHFRLREVGLSVRQVVSALYAYSIVMGVIALQFEGRLKSMFLLGFSVIVFVFLLSLSLHLRGVSKNTV